MRREGGNHGPEEGALSEGTWRKRGRTEQQRRVPRQHRGPWLPHVERVLSPGQVPPLNR